MFTQSVVCCVYVVYEQALSVSLFSSEGEKIIDKAQLPEFVELQSPNGRQKYELTSFIMRTGDTPEYGHYRNFMQVRNISATKNINSCKILPSYKSLFIKN